MLNQIKLNLSRLLLNPRPSKLWKTLRFFLNWMTLPLKLLLIGGLGIYQIIKHKFVSKNREPNPKNFTINVDELLNKLPIIDNGHLKCYANRVPFGEIANGTNHNTDHQCSRNATYAFLRYKLGLPNDPALEKGVFSHIQGKYLCRGYTTNGYYNANSTSGDMLCGLNLAMLNMDSDIGKERFEQLIDGILDNDYSLLEGNRPTDEPILEQIYDEALLAAQNRPEMVLMKSERGMWQPSIENVGAQALTILSALRVADVKCNNTRAREAYWKLLWIHGQGLLSIFPTAYIDNRRGYFNDHNCLISLYVLSKLSGSKLGKLFWKIPMYYVWSLSKHWYNAYFTGLMFDAYPEMLKNPSNYEYLQKCMAYLMEPSIDDVVKRPMEYTNPEVLTNIVPVNIKDMKEDEFYPDMGHNIVVQEAPNNTQYYRSGLGYLAGLTMVMSCLEKYKKDKENGKI